MKVEFCKFYEVKRDGEHLVGTLHVRLPEIGLNIKGIHVLKKKDFWFIGLPNKKGFDHSLDREVMYTVVLFDERAKNDELISIIRLEGRKFVEDYLNSNPQALETPKPSDQGQPKDELQECKDSQPEQKKTALPEPLPFKKPVIEWKDPQPKKSTFARNASKRVL